MRPFLLPFFAFALVVVSTGSTGCAIPEPDSKPQPAVSKEPEAPEPPDLITEDLKVGTGPEAKKGDHVLVHYTGKLAKNGKQFDSSIGKEPLPVTLGEGGVIEGWDKGLVGMKVGGKRKLTIPSRLGYKEKGSPPKIPPNATLLFDVELVKIGEDKKDDKADEDDADKDKKGDKDKKDDGKKGDKKDDGKKDDKKKVEKDDKKKDEPKKDEKAKKPEPKPDEAKKPAKP